MTCVKDGDMDSVESNTDKQNETTNLFLAWLDAWTMTVLECLGTDESRGETRPKRFV